MPTKTAKKIPTRAKKASASTKTKTKKKTKKTTKKKAPARVKTAATEPAAPVATGPRRMVFIDVENTSSEADLMRVVDELKIDLSSGTTMVTAIGNWRVVGQQLGRTLAMRGAHLVHSAPAPRVSDWSDLWIAVEAGIWLGRARPGDSIDVVSHDRAFDAVGDAAARLGVAFQRITYRGGSELRDRADRRGERDGGGGGRRPAAGGKRWGTGSRPRARQAPTPPAEVVTHTGDVWVSEPGESAPLAAAPDDAPHGASPEELRAAIARLAGADPSRTVTLDALTAALKKAGFQRPAGSPRLVTRLRATAGVEILPNARVRLAADAGAREGEHSIGPPAPPEGPRRSRGRHRRTGRGRMPSGRGTDPQ